MQNSHDYILNYTWSLIKIPPGNNTKVDCGTAFILSEPDFKPGPSSSTLFPTQFLPKTHRLTLCLNDKMSHIYVGNGLIYQSRISRFTTEEITFTPQLLLPMVCNPTLITSKWYQISNRTLSVTLNQKDPWMDEKWVLDFIHRISKLISV